MLRALRVLPLLLAACGGDDGGDAAVVGESPDPSVVYAPAFFHDVDDTKPEADLPTRLDFDGDWRSDNNWEHLDDFRAGNAAYTPRAWVYVARTETVTHWFLFYGLFHPQDWDDSLLAAFGSMQHENDFEGVTIVARKSDGSVEYVAAQAHGTITYAAASEVTFDDPEQRRVRFFVEAKGHGIYHEHTSLAGADFPGGDGFVFRRTGVAEYAFDPSLDRDAGDPARREVGYALRPMLPVWEKRLEPAGDGQFWGGTMTYGGYRFSIAGPIGSILDGDNYGDDVASLPWNWSSGVTDVRRGDWAIDPAWAFKQRFGRGDDFSLEYVRNPYLGVGL